MSNVELNLPSNPRQIHVKYGIEHRLHLFNQTRDSISYKESHNILCMGSRIPKPIRLEALRKWLDGKFRDDIAKELQISQGAVSSIINDFRKDDSQFDLLREVAVKVKKQGMDPASFAPLIRLCEVIIEKCSLTGTTGQESLEQIQNRME